jgi:GT2 family glycosyltransferase
MTPPAAAMLSSSGTFEKSVEAFSAGRLAEAYGLLLEALWGEPSHARTLHLLSEICIRLGAEELALAYSEAAISADPTFCAALAVQVEVAIRRGDPVRAAALLKDYPATGEFQQMHGLLRHRLRVAEKDYEVALAELAEMIDGRGDLVLARQLFEQSFRAFAACSDAERFASFLDALGLWFDRTGSQRRELVPTPASVDVVIPVHNALNHLQGCIESIRRYPDPAMRRIILVDDASDAMTATWMRRFVAENVDTVLVRIDENLGFTRSALAGIAASDSPFFILLNSDTIVSHGWITGLWRGIVARDDHAMAGPLSNLAYFQSLAPYGPAVEPTDLAELERRAAFVRAMGAAEYPVFPFLSGFCLMVRRKHYDAAGGLDGESYPRGYWEVQDLALRMIDLGLVPCLVDDVYVHHLESRSIEAGQRAALLSDGFRQICNRHGAIRVLAAEEICCASAALTSQRAALATFLAPPKVPVATISAVERHVAYRWHVAPTEGLVARGSEFCLFVAHAPFGQLSEWTARYLRALRDAGLRVIVCLAVENVDAPVQPDWADHADAVLLRANAGFDFGAWADLLRLLPDLWTAGRLVFANDSVVGPFKPLLDLFDRVRADDAGFFALTDATVSTYHAQSYLFGWAGRNLSDAGLRAFWAGIQNMTDKQAVIDRYEIALWGLCDGLPDPSRQILFGLSDLFGTHVDLLPPFSAAHWGWKALIDLGNPFVKTAVLRDEPGAIEAVAALTGADAAMLRRHVEQARIAALLPECY